MASFNASELNRRLREAQRRAEQQVRQRVDQINRANQRAVDDYNRKAEAHNRRVIEAANARMREQNRRIEAHNRQTISNFNRQLQARDQKMIAELNRQLRSSTSSVRYTEPELRLVDRVHEAAAAVDQREYDSFLSYARIDGHEVANELRAGLEALGVAVWFDEVAIVPGRSQSLQMDAGLRKARTGVALLTPAYLAGRFWTERELGALLSKSTLIPVLHNVKFEDVKQYSGILPDLAGFSTASDSVCDIAQKIAAAVLVETA